MSSIAQCAQCGREFVSSGSGHIYCSKRCRNVVAYARESKRQRSVRPDNPGCAALAVLRGYKRYEKRAAEIEAQYPPMVAVVNYRADRWGGVQTGVPDAE